MNFMFANFSFDWMRYQFYKLTYKISLKIIFNKKTIRVSITELIRTSLQIEFRLLVFPLIRGTFMILFDTIIIMNIAINIGNPNSPLS